MKTTMLYLVLFITCLSCGTKSDSISDSEKDKIKDEVKTVVNAIFKAAEEANVDLATKSWLDSPDFYYTSNGQIFTYADLSLLKEFFTLIQNQTITIVDEKIAIVDVSTVIYIANTDCVVNFKDGHSILQSPWITQFLFKKIDGDWRVINCSEGGAEQYVKKTTEQEALNQMELMKQYIGIFKSEGKDTVVYNDQVDKGKWHETSIKYVSKGKVVREGKQLWAYDKKSDKVVHMSIIDGVRLSVFTSWFTSKNKYIMVPYSGTSNSDETGGFIIGEFTAPDSLTETMFVNGQTLWSETYSRVKK